MSYIDIFIPLAAGIMALAFPDVLFPKKDVTNEKKKSLLKKAGFVLIGVSALYLLVLLLNSK